MPKSLVRTFNPQIQDPIKFFIFVFLPLLRYSSSRESCMHLMRLGLGNKVIRDAQYLGVLVQLELDL